MSESRSVQSLARRFNCYFIHNSIDPFSVGHDLAWIIRLRGVISCSTLRPMSNDCSAGNKIIGCGHFGVLLKAGNVVSGMPHDMGSVNVGLRARRTLYDDVAGSIASIEQAINRPYEKPVINGKWVMNGEYNELIIENPIVAGFYNLGNFDDLPKSENDGTIVLRNTVIGGITVTDHELLFYFWKKAYDLHLPLFIMSPLNQVRRLHDINFEEQSFKLSGDLSPQELIEPSWPWSLIEGD
jgi:hypothetical protein